MFLYRTCRCAVIRLHLIGRIAIGKENEVRNEKDESVATYETTELVITVMLHLTEQTIKNNYIEY